MLTPIFPILCRKPLFLKYIRHDFESAIVGFVFLKNSMKYPCFKNVYITCGIEVLWGVCVYVLQIFIFYDIGNVYI